MLWSRLLDWALRWLRRSLGRRRWAVGWWSGWLRRRQLWSRLFDLAWRLLRLRRSFGWRRWAIRWWSGWLRRRKLWSRLFDLAWRLLRRLRRLRRSFGRRRWAIRWWIGWLRRRQLRPWLLLAWRLRRSFGRRHRPDIRWLHRAVARRTRRPRRLLLRALLRHGQMGGGARQALIVLLIALRCTLATISVTIDGGREIVPVSVAALLPRAGVALADDRSVTTDEYRFASITTHDAGVDDRHLPCLPVRHLGAGHLAIDGGFACLRSGDGDSSALVDRTSWRPDG